MSNTTTPPSRPGEPPKERTGCRRAFLIMLAVLGIFVLLGIVGIAVLLALRKPWVEPAPGIDLTPKRPVLYCDEVPPDSACGLLLQATAKVDQHAYYLLETAARKWDVQPWPEGALLKASSTALSGSLSAPMRTPQKIVRRGPPTQRCSRWTVRGIALKSKKSEAPSRNSGLPSNSHGRPLRRRIIKFACLLIPNTYEHRFSPASGHW